MIHPSDAATGVPDRSLQKSLNRLRFDEPLETEFRRFNEETSLGSRLAMILISITAVALSPAYDALFLHPPAAFVPMARLIQFGFEIPALLISLLCCLPPLRRFLPAGIIIGVMATSGGLMVQRILGAPYGFMVPFDFAPAAIATIYVLGRLRFLMFFPWALTILLAATAAEIFTFGASSAALYNCLSLGIMFAMLSAGGFLLERGIRENWFHRRQLAMMALHDPLTGLPNRRHFDNALIRLLRSAVRERGNVALMVLDIDDFKSYNDRYGHPAGDACLAKIGQWLSEQMRRPQDFCARIGGEEFVALWCNATPAAARQMAEQLRQGIAALGIASGAPVESDAPASVVTASGGFVEVLTPSSDIAIPQLAQQLLRQADQLLYEAKRAGRNRLMLADTP